MAEPVRVALNVDATSRGEPITPIWNWFGYDEPNYTYMPHGRKLLDDLAGLVHGPVHVRAHNLLTSGDGTPALKWGSTDAYTRGSRRPPGLFVGDPRPHLRHLRRGGRHAFRPGRLHAGGALDRPASLSPRLPADAGITTGWAWPPKDYDRWGGADRSLGAASRRALRHGAGERLAVGSLERAGRALLARHDRRILPFARRRRRRDPARHSRSPRRRTAHLRAARPERGRVPRAPSSAIARAARTTPPARPARGSTSSPSTPRAGRDSSTGTCAWESRNSSAPSPQGSTSCSEFPRIRRRAGDPRRIRSGGLRRLLRPHASRKRLSRRTALRRLGRRGDRADAGACRARRRITIEGAVTWAFEFEGEPYFAGYRELATNGIAKPV